MTTQELKNVLTLRISEIEDHTFLEAVKTILDIKTESQMLIENSILASEIDDSREEIEKGFYIDDNLLEEEIDEWLKEKFHEFE